MAQPFQKSSMVHRPADSLKPPYWDIAGAIGIMTVFVVLAFLNESMDEEPPAPPPVAPQVAPVEVKREVTWEEAYRQHKQFTDGVRQQLDLIEDSTNELIQR